MKKTWPLPLRTLTVLMTLTLVTACAMTSVRQHPDFASAKRTPKTIAVLPPDVEYVQITFDGEDQRDSAKEADIAAKLSSEIKGTIEERGYKPAMGLLERLNGSDKELSFQYEQFKTAYAQASKDLYAKGAVPEDESTKFKVSVGPIANTFSAASAADALVYVRFWGFDKSGGQTAKEMAGAVLLAALTGVMRVPASTGGRIELAVIDGTSGEVLWSNTFGAPNQNYSGILKGVIAKLPSGSTPNTTAATPETAAASTGAQQNPPEAPAAALAPTR